MSKETTHHGMPHSAIAIGSVDHILPVAKMPAVISDYAAHPYKAHGQSTQGLGVQARGLLLEIIVVLKVHSPINFEYYKDGTLVRRIERRMALRYRESSLDYLALLRDSPEETERRCADLLISVTSLRKDVKLQIFALEVDEHALSVARAGVYLYAIAADLSPERLSRLFIKEDHSYCVTPELRDDESWFASC